MVDHASTDVNAGNVGSDVKEADLDMAGAIVALKRHARLIASAAGLGGLIALGIVNLVSPRYAAEVRVVIENRETALTRAGKDRAGAQDDAVNLDPEAISSQVQIAYSRDLARAVIRDLDLANVSEFNPLASPTGLLSGALGFVGLGRDIARLSPEERALDAYFERLTVAPVDKSRVIEIRFWSTDAALAARIANTISERFIDLQTRDKLERDRKVRRYFEHKIDDLRTTVADAEGKVQQFRGEADLLTGVNNLTLASQSLTELTAQLTAAQGQQAEAEARARSIRDLLKSGRPIESAEVFASPLMQRLTERAAALRAEHALQATVLLPGHPRMRELQAQLADNQQQIRGQAERIIRGIENDARSAGDRMRAIQQALEEKKRNTNSNGDKEVALRALEREAKAQRDLLEDWLALYRDAAARDSLDARAANARVVSRAEPGNIPVFPKKLPIVLITILTVASVAVAAVVGMALTAGAGEENARVQPLERREPELSYPVFGAADPEPAVPTGERMIEPEAAMALPVDQEESAPEIARRDTPDEIAAWQEDLEREKDDHRDAPFAAAAALARPDEQEHRNFGMARLAAKLVVVTGVTNARGEALLTLELAAGLAARGRRVIVLDAHRGAETLAGEVGVTLAHSLSDIATGRIGLAAAIQPIPGMAAHLLGDGGADSDALDFSTPRLSMALEALGLSYDSVLVRVASLGQGRDLVRHAGGAATIAIEAPDADDPLAKAAERSLALAGVGDILILPRQERNRTSAARRAA